MTLFEAVESLEFIEVAAVSWINIIPIQKHHIAYFQIAFGLPFLDTKLPDEFRTRAPRFWPDQERALTSMVPIQDQILEVHETGMLGDLASLYLPPMKGKACGLWTIETHSGSDQNRLRWIEDVISLEGRTPVRDSMRIGISPDASKYTSSTSTAQRNKGRS